MKKNSLTRSWSLILLFTVGLMASSALYAQKITLTVSNQTTYWNFKIATDEDKLWIDKNNDGIEEDDEWVSDFSEPISFSATSKTIVLHGSISELRVEQGGLTAIAFEGCADLHELDLGINSLKTINLSEAPNLWYLNVRQNQLEKIDISMLADLKELECSDNQIKELVVPKSSEVLEVISANNNQLKSFSTKGLSALEFITFRNNGMESISFEDASALQTVGIENNLFTAVDFGEAADVLEDLYISGNQFATLDLTHLPALVEVAAQNNKLTDLKLPNTETLKRVHCYKNQLSNEKITQLIANLPTHNAEWKGDLYVIDSSEEAGEKNVLTQEHIDAAKAKFWNVYDYLGGDSYGKNEAKPFGSEEGKEPNPSEPYVEFTTSKTEGNWHFMYYTSFIPKDDPSDVWFDANGNGLHEESEDLDMNGEIKSIPITAQTVRLYGSLRAIMILKMDLESIDISHNPNLTTVTVSHNNLTKLDASKNTNLRYLNCDHNKISSLSINSPRLERLCIDMNQLGREAMQQFIEQLPDRNIPLYEGDAPAEGTLWAISPASKEEGNILDEYWVKVANAKNWEVYAVDMIGEEDFNAYLYEGTNVAVQEVADVEQMHVFPVPATDVLNISIPATAEGVVAYLFDTNGALVATQKLLSQDSTLAVDHLPAGTYILKVGTQTTRVAIAR